jgi:eukaryotic-like serine/threonine-protein kinase
MSEAAVSPGGSKRPSSFPRWRWTGHDNEEGRALYQERVALYGKLTFFLGVGVFVFLNGLGYVLVPEFTLALLFSFPGSWFHLGGSAVSGLVWWWASRGMRSPRSLLYVDWVGTLAMLGCYALMCWSSLEHLYDRDDLLFGLVMMLILMARALIVPSTARQTALMGTVVAVFAGVVTFRAAQLDPRHAGDVAMDVLHVAGGMAWSVLTVVTASLGSQVIYGLRAEAQAARQLGQYVLEDQIGQGGMGTVYRARHALLRRPTAVKLLSPESAGAHNLARFEREVRLTSRLTHPNTVAIYDYGRTSDGVFYYAMEHLDGLDLQEVVDRDGPQDPARVVHILAQVCGALAEAHSIGLVHRDIKPANIILADRGGVLDTAKVVDFGLVKELERQDEVALSSANTIMGTPLYMSPEAIVSPDDVDGRSDLYAVGAVAYFLLTGGPVFDGKSVIEVCGQHVHEKPLPPSRRTGRALPAELEAIVLGCLAKSPDDRPQSARQLRDRLLACGVPPWTEAQAQAWWEGASDTHRALRHGSGERRRGAATPPTLKIDLGRRAVH